MSMATVEANRIVVRLDGDGWVADHEGEVAKEVISIMGTATLPTPFLMATPGHLVVDTLRQLNPGVEVVFA